jgi:hypothetical protein
MNLKSILGATAIAVGLLGAAVPANAAFILTTGNDGGGSVDNVVFDPCGLGNQLPGTTVQGCLQGDTSRLVNFTSSSTLVADGGQASITGLNGAAFHDLTIALAPPQAGYTRLVFNIDAIAGSGQTGITFNLTGTGTPTQFQSTLGQNGSNFFTFTATDGDIIQSVSFTTLANVNAVGDVAQVRIAAVPVPEPMSLALFGAGLLGLGMVKRRKQEA